MRDLVKEIWESIRRNKLRTCLTGLSVSWGLLMLITLLGAGNGVKNSFSSDMMDNSSDLMSISGGLTSKPYNGLKEGRRIRLYARDTKPLETAQFQDKIYNVMTRVSESGTATLGKKYSSVRLEGCFPGMLLSEHLTLLHGRFINDNDLKQTRKVAVVSANLAELLLEDRPVKDIVGKDIIISGLAYKVVGVTKTDETDNRRFAYIPENVLRTIYMEGDKANEISFNFRNIDSEKENEEFESAIRAAINTRHDAAPDDKRALRVFNSFSQNLMLNKAGRILNIALWIIGIFTLLGGIVGVSNIMLITVKERTHEFGIRKAIGASPAQIVKLIISESVAITAVFGYIGMFLGMVACKILDLRFSGNSMEVLGASFKLMENPSVGLDVALEATALLIIAGTVAGLVPAMKAAKVKPIEALTA